MKETTGASPQKRCWEQILPLHKKIWKIEKGAGGLLTSEQCAQIKKIESDILGITKRYKESKNAGKIRYPNAPTRKSYFDFELVYRALGKVLASIKASEVEANLVVLEASLQNAKKNTEDFLVLLNKAESGDMCALEWFLDVFHTNEILRFNDVKVEDENRKRRIRSVDDLLLLKLTKPGIFARLFDQARGTYYRKGKRPWAPPKSPVLKHALVNDHNSNTITQLEFVVGQLDSYLGYALNDLKDDYMSKIIKLRIGYYGRILSLKKVRLIVGYSEQNVRVFEQKAIAILRNVEHYDTMLKIISDWREDTA